MKNKRLYARIAVIGLFMYILGFCIPMTLADTGTIDGAPTPCGLEVGRLADCLKPSNAPDFKSQLDLEKGSATDNIKQVISLIAGGVAALAGTAAILFIVIHGLRLATAGADEGRRTEAMKSIQWTILGLILVIFAYVVVLVVLDVVTTIGGTSSVQQQEAVNSDRDATLGGIMDVADNEEEARLDHINSAVDASSSNAQGGETQTSSSSGVVNEGLIHDQQNNGMTSTSGVSNDRELGQ